MWAVQKALRKRRTVSQGELAKQASLRVTRILRSIPCRYITTILAHAPWVTVHLSTILTIKAYGKLAVTNVEMPSIIQTAFALEALVNVLPIVSLTCFPTQTLRHFLASPLPSLELNGTTVVLARSLGVLIIALTPQLLLAYPNSKDCVGKRRLAYWTLGTGEAALIPLLLWEAFRETDKSKAAGAWAGGLSRSFCLLAVANLVPVLAWRLYVFQWKPHWFGDIQDVADKAKKSH